MKFDAVSGMTSMNSSALKDPSVVSKVTIGFVDDAIACIRLLLALLRVLREEEETTFLITRRSGDEDIFEVLRKNLISKSKKTLSWSSSILLFAQY